MRKVYARLEQELLGEDYGLLLHGLKKSSLFFQRFGTWPDVVGFMRDKSSNANLTDEVLQPIFKAHAETRDYRWRTILLVIFWPGLRSIHNKKSAWDRDLDERWQNIAWTFLEVVCRIDIRRRPDRLVQKVINDTIHDLYEKYLRTWSMKKREIAFRNENEFRLLPGGKDGIEYAFVELHEMQNLEIKRLRAHMEEGRINEADFLLIVGTRVYGKSIADYAREEGINYQVAKKRRQRAEATISTHEKNTNSCPQKCGEPPFSL